MNARIFTITTVLALPACAGEFKPDLGQTGTGPTSSSDTGSTGDETGSTGDETGDTGSSSDTGSTGDETDTGSTGVPDGCGDGEAMGMEECDGLDLRGQECTGLVAPTDQNFSGGMLACNEDCTYDTSSCFYCGDGVKNGPGEQCDQDDLGGLSCESEGYDGGDLSCAADCVPDETACANCEGDPEGPYGKANVGCQGGLGMSQGNDYWNICQYKPGCVDNADCFVEDLAICANQPVCDNTNGAYWCKILCDEDADCPGGMVCHDSGYGVICMWNG